MGHSPNPLLANRLLMYRNRVPKGVRFWLIILFALFYQLSGGIYLAALSQMVGELAFLSEDVTMAGYCSLIGLNMIFPILFRWKFYLYTRQMFFVSSIGALICAIAHDRLRAVDVMARVSVGGVFQDDGDVRLHEYDSIEHHACAE